jgi:hypothetical protein
MNRERTRNRVVSSGKKPFTPLDLVGGSSIARHYSARDSVIYSDSGDTTLAAVDDAINGTVTDLTGNGNDATGNGLTLREDANGHRCFRIDDDVVSMDFNFTDLPPTFTAVYVLNRRTDNFGYTIGSAGESKGLALVQNADAEPAIGIGASASEVSFNNKVYASAKRQTFLDVLTTTGTCVVLQEFSGATGVAATTWGIGHGTYKLQGDYYDIFLIDRALTAEEKVKIVQYMGLTYGRALTGRPLKTIVTGFWGQSNTESRATDGHVSPVTLPSTSRSFNYNRATEEFDPIPLTDPVSGGQLGQSMVPAFVVELERLKDQPICCVMGAVGGTYLLPEASSDWGKNGSTDGGSRANLKTWVDEAIALMANHADYEFDALYVGGNQSEAEAAADNGSTIDSSLYSAARQNLAEDLNTYFTGLYGAKYKGMFDLLSPLRYEDSTHRAGQWSDMVMHAIEYNDATVDAGKNSPYMEVVYKRAPAFQSIGYASDNVHNDTRAQQLSGKMLARGMAGEITEPATPSSPFISSEIFMDETQSTKSSDTATITTAEGTECLFIVVTGHLFSNGSGQIHPDVTFDGVQMYCCGMAEVENTTAGQLAEVAAAIYFLHEDQYGASLSGVTGEIAFGTETIVDDNAKTVDVINAAAVYTQNVWWPDRYIGSEVTATDTASHDVTPLLGSFLLNVTAANYDSATAATATVTGLTEIHNESFTIAASAQTAQITISWGVVDAETTQNVSTAFSGTMDAIVSITTAMPGKYDGEEWVDIEI